MSFVNCFVSDDYLVNWAEDVRGHACGVHYFTALYRTLASSRTRLLDYTQRRATIGRIPLKE